ncbi:putative 3-hydroxybutyryl-CoA dehydrogenase [Candidatus Zixiibacteriota bacterium]|nr:putative 3-hydroxybutyryl-CoA dehydrogenase [candidate division Zixibacteria bacterium]
MKMAGFMDMHLDDIKIIGVVGGGTMGNGIAHVCSQGGYDVILVDTSNEILEKAKKTITVNLDRMIKKEKITEQDKNNTLNRIYFGTKLDDLREAQLIVEAIYENLEAKIAVFKQLDMICTNGAILASNTSSLPITQLAATTRRAERVIGMHFMNPVPMMSLVELIRGIATSDETFHLTQELSRRLGKTPVEVNDFPGFISNRILMPMINEAIYALMEGVASAEDIDTVMKLGMNHPMGPLTLADFIGLDVCLAIMEVLYKGFSDSKYRPCPLLWKMVQAGYLGRKTGRGFFIYEK